MLAIAEQLTQDGLVLRYKVEGTNTGFDGDEGTFTISGAPSHGAQCGSSAGSVIK